MVGRCGGGVRVRPAIELPPDFAAELARQGLAINAVSAAERVMRALVVICNRNRRPARSREIVCATGIPFRTVKNALAALTAEGRVLAAPDPRNPTWQLYIPKGGGNA